MSRNGSGTYSLPATYNPVTSGTTISSTAYNGTLTDIANALTASIANDGQTTPVANLPMGGYRHTNVANGVAATDYCALGQAQAQAFATLTSVAGTDTITATVAPAFGAYATGQVFRFIPAGANTTTAVTLNINGVGAKAVVKYGSSNLAVGDLQTGRLTEVYYDGTNFQLKTQPANVSATSVTTTNAVITGGSIDGTPIGGTTPSTGAFTTVTASTSVTSPTIGAGSGSALSLQSNGTTNATLDTSGNFNTTGSSSSTFFKASGSSGAGTSVGFFDFSSGSTRIISAGANSSTYGQIQFYGANASVANAVLYGMFDGSGNFLVGTTSSSVPSGYAFQWIQTVGGGAARFCHSTAAVSGDQFVGFFYNGTGIGSITQNGTTAVAYNTSSDYRLKANPQPLTGSGEFIDALQPKTWEWTADGSKGVGFIAHEVQAVSPTTVTGEKDAVDAEGKPVYQSMEYGSAEFIANIIAELQSLRKRCAALEAAVTLH